MRVFYAGAYKPPRQFNWVIGVMLLLLTLVPLVHRLPAPLGPAGVLGDHRRHEHRAATSRCSATTSGRSCSAAATSGSATLLRFYALHVYFVPPLLVVVLLHPHLARAQGRLRGRRSRGRAAAPEAEVAGVPEEVPRRCLTQDEPQARYRLLGVVPREIEQRDEQEPDDTVFTWPHFLIRHVVVAGDHVAVVFLLAILFNAPLQGLANPNLTPQEAKAPWYFAGLQELLSHFAADGRRDPDPGCGRAVPVRAAVPRPQQGMADPRSQDGRDRVHRARVAALVLTVIGAFFRGPGWSWVLPWHHLYLEL